MGENRRVMTTDDTLAAPVAERATETARAALVVQVGDAVVGEHLGAEPEGDGVVTEYFDCTQSGYPGWRWAVTVVAVEDAVTVDEVVLLPGDSAIVAPEWVPWRERIRPGDLSPGDVLPVEEDDPRLVPAYVSGDPGDGAPRDAAEQLQVKEVSEELGLGRVRVLSLEGRDLAAQRWYDGSHGPHAPIVESAPGSCSTCGFLVQLAGPMSRMFGVCANGYASDDGRVVSFDHGCGGHSEAKLGKKNLPQPLTEPVLDTLSWDDLEEF